MPIGEDIIFRCQHETADTIRWRVNSLLLGQNTPPNIIPNTFCDDNGNLVGTLTITARPDLEHNGTMVVCVARFDDGSKLNHLY